ncbi:MAG: trypsin-like peptidase domain-containing protein [bacterium]|nr:trypsin-like peptidase domain-containing protein [bacterium]
MKMRRFSLLTTIVLLLGLPALARSGAGSPSSPGELFRSVREALVLIGQGTPVADGGIALNWLGTGFLVNSDCTIATARHVLEGVPRDNLMIRAFDPKREDRVVTLPVRIVAESAERDLALLRVGSSLGGRCALAGVAAPKLAAAPLGPELTGEPVMLAGFPVLEGEQPRDVPILRAGHISSAELQVEGRPMLLLDLTGVPGFSGAPVLLQRTGEVVGVVFGPGRTPRQFDLNWATPLGRDDLRGMLADGSK